MALSGSIDFNLTRNEIINDALVKIGAIEGGETPDADVTASAARELNRMVKSWNNKGIQLWRQDDGVLHLTVSTASYSIGTGGDHATTDGDAIKTELSADAASGASTITVDSITNMAASDNIGIVLDSGSVDWTTISGSPSGSTVTLTDALTGAASTDNHVYVYTSLIDRPLRVFNPRRRGADGNDVPIIPVSREEYMGTPNKTNTGPPVHVYYDPQLTTGTMYLWPAPDSSDDRIFFTAHLPLQDFDSSADNPDIPQEWLDAMVWNLADRLAIDYPVAGQEGVLLRQEIRSRARELLDDAMDFNVEPDSVFFQPAMER